MEDQNIEACHENISSKSHLPHYLLPQNRQANSQRMERRCHQNIFPTQWKTYL